MEPFAVLAERYFNEASALSKQENLSPEAVLSCLLLRDRLAALVNTAKAEQDPLAIQHLTQGDKQLISLTKAIGRMPELKHWRNSLAPSTDWWWWHLSLPEQETIFTRFDWLWSAIAVILLTIASGLVVDISSRFLSGGADTRGAFTIITQTLITMLAAGGVLTKTGRQLFERILMRLNIEPHYWQEIQVVVAGVVLGALLLFRLYLPTVAESYYQRGFEQFEQGNLTSAQRQYERALELYPDYIEVHFSLGQLSETLRDLPKAQAEYRIAMQGSHPAAFNNLARLNILSGDYPTAVLLLLNGLECLNATESCPNGQAYTQTLSMPSNLRYEMRKNLGWARLEQERYPDAGAELRRAIDLQPEEAPAHCLLAQVLEAQGNPDQALVHWSNCLRYADRRQPDEDGWIYTAQQRQLTASTPITPTATLTETVALESHPGLNILLPLAGQVELKRNLWPTFHPTEFGAALRRGDQIAPSPSARVLVLCHDLSLWIVPDGVPSGLSNGCSVEGNSVLQRPTLSLTETLSLENNPNLPYIIAPRGTAVLTTTPLFRWNPLPGVTSYSYTVQLQQANQILWLTATTTNTLRYPGDPALAIGQNYGLQIQADGGTQANSAMDSTLTFSLLDSDTLAEVESAIAQIDSYDLLSSEARDFAVAHVYRSFGLYSAALEVLTPHLQNGSPRIALSMLVADIYLEQGLVREAQTIYSQAEALINTPEQEANLNLRLALVYHRLNRPSQAEIYRQAALQQFETLGDTATIQRIEDHFSP